MPRMEFNSFQELEKEMKDVTEIALEATMNEMLDKLHTIIEKDVYESYYGEWADSGLRTMEFLESWVVDNAQDLISNFSVGATLNNTSTRQIIQDISLLHEYRPFDDLPPIHMNKGTLADIIESGEGYTLDTEAPPRPFWEEFIEWSSKQAPKIFRKYCRQLGMNIQQV